MKFLRWALSVFGLYLSCSFATVAVNLTEPTSNLRFHPLAQNHKLSQPVVNDIVQDKQGFIWIATEDGLNRFDGQDVQIYRPTPGREGGINHTTVKQLTIDNDGVLWIGSEKGLNRYQSTTDDFAPFPGVNANITALNDANVRALFTDSLNRIWVGTRKGGVSVISADRQTLKHIAVNNAELASLPLFVHSFYQTQQQQILVATQRGLMRYNEQSQSLDVVSVASRRNIMQVFEVAPGRLLLGSTKGLWLYEQEQQSLSEIKPERLKGVYIVAMAKFDHSKVLIGTRNEGLYLFDSQSVELYHYSADPADKYAPTDNQIGVLYQSRDGLFWIGNNIGIDVLYPKQLRFGHIRLQNQSPQCLAGNTIYAIMLDKRNKLWVGAYGQGLNLIDLNTQQCRFVTGISGENSEQLKDVVSLYEAGDAVWIGTFKDGVVRYDSVSDTFTPLADLVSPGTKLPKNIQSIAGDASGNVWIATYDAGLFLYHHDNAQLSHIVPTTKDGLVGAFNDVLVDGDGHVWAAGDASGLWRLGVGEDEFKPVAGIAQRLWSVDIDSQGQLWLGTAGNGAIVYNPTTQQTKTYALTEGLLSNVVLNIREDGAGDIWFFTDRGLSRLNIKRDVIETFTERDGLQGDTFTTAGFYDRKQGMMWTGGFNGFNRFKPADIVPSAVTPEVALTRFELFYKPVSLKRDDNASPLTRVIGHSDRLFLDYQQNVFAFGFSALEYVEPEQIRYAFKLEGYDKEWNIVGADRRFANYTNIDPGQYVFKVKATNSEGHWGHVETKVDIVIEPPWWSTKTAILGYLAALWLAVYVLIAYRTKALRQQAETLSQAVEERTEELAQEKHKVEQLLERKNEEFASVSHEFRTPLTLILGPLSQLLAQTTEPQQKQKLGLIQRNGYRLLRMVDQLLQLQTLKVKAISPKQNQRSDKIIQLICQAFADLAKEKQLTLTLGSVAEVELALIPDALEKILLNLLSNAVKYSQPGATIEVFSTHTQNNCLHIQVKDTGIGIAREKLNKVFERYHRVHDNHSEKVSGAGIGLALVKSLIEVHGGQILLSSELGKGTCVDVYLPIQTDAKSANASYSNNEELFAMEIMGLQDGPLAQVPDSPEHNDADDSQDRPLVLVVEDNGDMSSYIEQTLIPNFRVIHAVNGEVGVEMAKKHIPDVVISDVMMPLKDGYQVTRELRADPLTDHIPIILLTAKGDQSSRIKGWDEKADEYLTKPFDGQELNIRISNLLDIRHILKRRFAESTFAVHSNQISESAKGAKSNAQDAQQAFIAKLDATIEQFYQDPSVSIAEFAQQMAMSERQLFRKLKQVLDVTPADYLRRFRLEQACVLLAEGKSVSFVAMEVGFSTQSYFGKCFKAQYGLSPGEYKKEMASKGHPAP